MFVRQQLLGNLGHRADESEIIRDTWLDVVKRLEQFHGKTDQEFFGWLKAILHDNLMNALSHQLASKGNLSKEIEVAFQDSASLQWWEPTTNDTTPRKQLIRGERALQLAKAIEDLPETQQIAIELRYLNGMKLSEVSEKMEYSADEVVALLRRGMQNLARLVGESN